MANSNYTFSFVILEKFSSYRDVVWERRESSKLQVSHQQRVMGARMWMTFIWVSQYSEMESTPRLEARGSSTHVTVEEAEVIKKEQLSNTRKFWANLRYKGEVSKKISR